MNEKQAAQAFIAQLMQLSHECVHTQRLDTQENPGRKVEKAVDAISSLVLPTDAKGLVCVECPCEARAKIRVSAGAGVRVFLCNPCTMMAAQAFASAPKIVTAGGPVVGSVGK